MNNKWQMIAPIAKAVETPDGGREVWGFATLERVDKAGEIADFAGTVAAFEKWSGEIEKRTGGKSKGNVRLMHQPIVVGKMIHWEPTETTIVNENGQEETVKAIWVGTYVPPTKPDVIKDIDEGILSAHSIGGSYAQRWWDETAKAHRYIPELAEYSLVDNPCVPGADIQQVISKTVAPWSKTERNLEKGGEQEGMEKNAPKGSYEEITQRIEDACQDKFTGPYSTWWDGYVVATFPDHVVVRDWSKDTYWDIPYSMDAEGCVQLGDPKEVERVETYVPAEAMKALQVEMAKREDLKTAADERANKHGIAFKDGKGHLTTPKGKPTDESEYGDPVNYAYPIDAAHIKAAVSYFNQDGQMEAGGYTAEEWAIIGKRIATAAKKLEGGDYAYEDGKIETPKEGTKVDAEKVVAALKAAGMSEEQMQTFIKALENDTPTSTTNVPTVDGDGDGDENKEFPNLPSGDEKINIEGGQASVKDAEKEVGIDPKSGPGAEEQNPGNPAKGDGATDLEKAGKAISKERSHHLAHAMNHIKAAVHGHAYGPDEHLAVENGSGDGNTGLESPTVTANGGDGAEKGTYTGSLAKTVGGLVADEVTKAVGGLGELLKGVASAEAVTKAVEAVEKANKMLEELAPLVKAIHDTPQSGGPVLGEGSPLIAQMMGKGAGSVNMANVEIDVLKGLLDSTQDPLVKDRVSQELAIRQHKAQMGAR